MGTPLPPPARILGPAGLIPFVALALLALAGEPWAGFALLAYGAAILAFLGGVHWGLALADGRAAWARMALGVLPSLVAALALLLPERTGLILVALALPATAAVEARAAIAGLLPRSYLRLRWVLSVGAAACCLVGALVA